MAYQCSICSYSTARKYNMLRHYENQHPEKNPVDLDNINQYDDTIDLRLIQNFKILVSGPSRCGKTWFTFNLIKNIRKISQDVPEKIVYVYSARQAGYEDWLKYVDHLVIADETAIDKVLTLAKSNKLLVIFDDLIHSDLLKDIAKLFTIDGRHMKMSLVFLTQRLFVQNEFYKQISRNSDYFVLFRNPRNQAEIRDLARQVTPNDLALSKLYEMATIKPYSYLFLNFTQEAKEDYKYLTRLFEQPNILYCYKKRMSTHGKKKPSFDEIKLRHSNYRVKKMSIMDDIIKQPFKLDEDLEEKSLNESDVFYQAVSNPEDINNTDLNDEDKPQHKPSHKTVNYLGENKVMPLQPENTPNQPQEPHHKTCTECKKNNTSHETASSVKNDNDIHMDDDENLDEIYSNENNTNFTSNKYCQLAEEMKTKIMDLITLRDHLVMKCKCPKPITESDIYAEIDTRKAGMRKKTPYEIYFDKHPRDEIVLSST